MTTPSSGCGPRWSGDRAPPGRVDERATARARRRYDRIAARYDAITGLVEPRARRWRRDLWARLAPGRVLELGVGTGANLPFYPRGREIVAMDLSPRMLARARRKADRLGVDVQLELGDVQRLAHPDASFDVAIASFLFCTVPDPVLGLAEIRRVLRPGGQLLLLEHVRSRRPFLRRLMGWLEPVTAWLLSDHIDRDTVTHVAAAGFVDLDVEALWLDVVQRMSARAP